jgi:hypothetical protein
MLFAIQVKVFFFKYAVEPPYPRIRYPRFYRGPKILTHSLPKSTMADFSIYVLICQRQL